ncbi:MAG: hypothetical protein M3Q30_19765 [Actinomycetota bacterium]|nr:hypothetical protein [Actinomycetota bacterium]
MEIRLYDGKHGTIDRWSDGWFVAKDRTGHVVGRRSSLDEAMRALALRTSALAELRSVNR